MTPPERRTREIELDLLLEGIYRVYHYDFRAYSRQSMHRRVAQALPVLGCSTVSSLLDRVLHDPAAFGSLLPRLTVQVSELFRDPPYWRCLRDEVLPELATHPFVRVWIAGCGVGEEAYSMAILLHEAGLLGRSQIYATDIDSSSLEGAAAGVYELDRFRTFSENYFAAGGHASLSAYYTTAYARAAMAPFLRQRILFSDHSLATDAAFAEVQLVSCRNVLIYFDRSLQSRAIGLFAESLCPRGFLGLGSHESLRLTDHADRFDVMDAERKLFRFKGAT